MAKRSTLYLAVTVALAPGAVLAEETRTLAPVEIIGDVEQARNAAWLRCGRGDTATGTRGHDRR